MKKESPFTTKFITAIALLAAADIVLWFLGRIGSSFVYFAISIAFAYDIAVCTALGRRNKA